MADRMTRDDPEDGTRRPTAQRRALSRRRLVAAGAATWASVALAGCDRIDDPGLPNNDGDDGDGDGDGDDGDGTPTGGTTVSNRTTTTGGDGGTPSGNETTTTPTPTTEEPTTTECANIRRFAAGMDVGLHVDVFDSESGEYLGADGLERVRVTCPEAPFESLDLAWEGPHEQFSSDGWGGKLSLDEDVDAGTYRYEISVEGDAVDGEGDTVVDEFTVV